MTLALPSALLKRVKVIAAENDTSISQLVRDLLEGLVRRSDEYASVWDKEMKVLQRGLPMSVGEIAWHRDDVHGR